MDNRVQLDELRKIIQEKFETEKHFTFIQLRNLPAVAK